MRRKNIESKYIKSSVLGVDTSVVDVHLALRFIEESVVTKKRVIVCIAAVHLITECQQNSKLLEDINKTSLVLPDGMPLVWLLKLSGYQNVERVYGPTLMTKLCSIAAKRKQGVFLLGGARGQSEKVQRELLQKFSTLRIVGLCDTPVRPIPRQKNQKIVAAINKSRADIVFVGLGCPEQELWMIRNRKKLIAPALIGVGAAFDFLSGRVRQAPAWIGRSGFEWLFRLIQEPQRLWRRYTITNIKFIYYLGKYIFRFAR